MKRIEVVLNNLALENFRELASQLGIGEFEATEVRRSSTRCAGRQRVFRGQTYTLDLPVRTRIAFVAGDEDVERIIRQVAGAIRPDSISIVSIHQIDLADLKSSESAEALPRGNRAIEPIDANAS